MARIALPPPEQMTPAQAQACAEVSSGKRGKVPAPMIGWLLNPEMARRTQHLGELLRYDTSMSDDLVELAIIVCARHWTAHVAWKAHKAYALKAGLHPRIADAIAARQEPVFADERQRLVYEVSQALLKTSRVEDDLYARAVAVLGEVGIAELAVLLGYYTIAAFTLNTFELGQPETVAPELNDPQAS